jgi:hypothetical protein
MVSLYPNMEETAEVYTEMIFLVDRSGSMSRPSGPGDPSRIAQGFGVRAIYNSFASSRYAAYIFEKYPRGYTV